jgi:uncharacterized protein DUF1697
MDHQSVAFFRNLNLGQRRSHSPTRPELLDALERAGARNPVSFQVNGTVIFGSDTDPQAVADEAVARLTPVCGYADAVIVRPVGWVLDLELTEAPDSEVSLFDGPDPFPHELPWVTGNGVTVVRADHLHAVSLNDVERTSGATWTLERLLGMPVTSRGVPTMMRLQARLHSLAQS